jgi:hypothetical protein
MSLADRILQFNESLSFKGELPAGVNILNPFFTSDVKELTKKFYKKYFDDELPRYIILGINPGRFGAGATGIPFTDTVRLNEKCGISLEKFRTYEPSSAFIYDMILSYGSVGEFYEKFLFSAVCPLGFTNDNEKGRAVNYNYYDSPVLMKAVYPFILETIQQQLNLGIRREIGFCLGTGKNDAFLRKINNKFHFFEKIITLEHPRYILQYRARFKDDYIRKYVDSFSVEFM